VSLTSCRLLSFWESLSGGRCSCLWGVGCPRFAVTAAYISTPLGILIFNGSIGIAPLPLFNLAVHILLVRTVAVHILPVAAIVLLYISFLVALIYISFPIDGYTFAAD